jgi:hypothetical protein
MPDNMRQTRRKRQTATERRAAALKALAASRETLSAAKRHLNTHLGLWRVCGRKACARARGCRGEPTDCHARWWPHVPEDVKIEFRTAIIAARDGASPQEATRIAKAEAQRWRDLQARMAAREQAAASAPGELPVAPAEPTVPATAGAAAPPRPTAPRLRSL